MRATARRFGLSLSTLQYWLQKAKGRRVTPSCFADAIRGPKAGPKRTAPALEEQILRLRQDLAAGPLGACGAAAIQAALRLQGLASSALPCVRTIGRILERNGLLDGRTRVRRPPPPRGWYLPTLASRQLELDAFDGVEGLALRGGLRLEVFNAISHWGGLPGSWPSASPLSTDFILQALQEHWQTFGLPAFAQFDNDTLFQGAHHFVDTFSRVMRFCLQLGVVPVFVPPYEMGFQAQIEGYNARWQAMVWKRFTHPDFAAVQTRSDDFLRALRAHSARRLESAPARRPWPAHFRFQPKALPEGILIYLRRTDLDGHASVLGRPYLVDPAWQGRLVRAELHLKDNQLSFYALRRRDHTHQPLLNTITYMPHVPGKPHGKAAPDHAALNLPQIRKKR